LSTGQGPIRFPSLCGEKMMRARFSDRTGTFKGGFKMKLQFVALLTTSFLAFPALAQTSAPAPKAKAPPAQQPQQQPPALPVQSVLTPALAPQPTYDEGTAQRIAAAMLSYSAIVRRGSRPTLPANAHR